MDLANLFEYELCPVPCSLMNEYGFLRKGTKSCLVPLLCVLQSQPKEPSITIVDAQQLLYHVTWPLKANVEALFKSVKSYLDLCKGKKILVFDKYHTMSAKDHERVRRAGLGSVDYCLGPDIPLPKRDAVMKNKANKLSLSKLLCTFDFGFDIQVECNNLDQNFMHDEADVTMISFVLKAYDDGASVIRVISNDTDVFVLLVYWIYKANIKAEVQMKTWKGKVYHINATCEKLGANCLQLLGFHYMTGSDATSFPYGKGKVSSWKLISSKYIQGLECVLGEIESTDHQLLQVGKEFFLSLYKRKMSKTMADARYTLYMQKRGGCLKLSSLPPCEESLLLHVKRVHLQMILAKSANKQSPPFLNISDFGWTVVDGIPTPQLGKDPPIPPELSDMVSCGCKVIGKACKGRCSCKQANMSCTAYCACSQQDTCFNPFTGKGQNDIEEDSD